MSYSVTITFLVEAESEEILERYVDGLVYDLASRENFLLDNREIREVAMPLPGSFRKICETDLPYAGR